MCVGSTFLNMTIMERENFYDQDKLMQGRVGERGSEWSERVTFLQCTACFQFIYKGHPQSHSNRVWEYPRKRKQ